MAVFYVDSNIGTRTTGGGYGSFQTGTFAALGAANVYGNVEDALSDGAGANDYILASHLHDHTYAGNCYWLLTDVNDPLTVMSVSSTDVEQYTKGAREATANDGASDQRITGTQHVYGFTFFSSDQYQIQVSGTHVKMYDCLIEDLAGGNNVVVSSDGSSLELYDCVVNYSSVTASGFSVTRGAKLTMIGGGITSTAGGDGNVNSVTRNGFGAGGGNATYIGVDFSIVDVQLIANIGGNLGSDDQINIFFDRCILNASVSLCTEDMAAADKQVMAINSDGVDTAFDCKVFGAQITTDTAFYRDDSAAFTESGNKASFKVVTSSLASTNKPAAFDFTSQYYTLSDTATDTLRVYVLSSTALTDEDLYFDVVYPDGTTISQPNILTSTSLTLGASLPWFNPIASLTATPVALTANTDTWAGRTTENRYQIDIDTSADAGSDCAPIITMRFGVPSATIYISTDIDGV